MMKKKLIGLCLMSILSLTLNLALVYANESHTTEVNTPKSDTTIMPYNIEDPVDWV